MCSSIPGVLVNLKAQRHMKKTIEGHILEHFSALSKEPILMFRKANFQN